MSEELTQRLERCYTGVIHDVMRAMGLSDFTLPPDLRPLLPGQKLAGPAFTVEGKTGEFDAHETLLAWTGLLSAAKPGHVWVCQPNTEEVANMGELSAETLKNKGVRGCVIDGLSRDTEFMIDMNFQTFFKGYTPRDIVGFWLPKAVEEPIKIGSVWIRPGDYILGDRDGVVRIPAEIVEEVITKAENDISREDKVRNAILSGVDPQEAYLQFGKF
jgi:4-hydroxy-4-methyl-2-oxoglutarate aldolase